MLTTTLASLRHRSARLAQSALAIVASVGFVAGTLTLSDSLKQAYNASFAAGAANVSAVLAARKSGDPPGQFGGQTLPAPVLADVRAVPGVAAAAGRLTGPAPLVGSDGKAIGNGFGISIAADPALNGFTVVSGHLPAAPGQVAVDKATAADQHFRLGQPVQVVTHTGARRTFRLVATIDLGVTRAVVAIVSGGTGIALTIAGAGHVRGNTGLGEIAAGGCLCFVAVLALGPLFVPPVMSVLGWLPGRLAGPTATLATASTRRNPHRIAATTAALSIGITLMTLFTVVVSSVQASTDAAIAGHFPFDYLVKASQNGQYVPARITRSLRNHPGSALSRRTTPPRRRG